ncbi:MAG: DNA-processing protein DprA [Lactobacillaceae bacterium]|jgi:DNA processing protein|nr:DNA-processing protein DprA [Lactobacillaceae bacterium]
MNTSNYLFLLRQIADNKTAHKIYKQIQELRMIVPLGADFLTPFLSDEQIDHLAQMCLEFREENLPDFIAISDRIYPDRLREIYNAPVILYYSGNLELLTTNTITVVGGRNFDAYGHKITDQLIPYLVDQNYTIVSGLARGIDSYAQELTLKNQGSTIAVIGSGIDVYYPYENRELQKTISSKHLTLSEYPTGMRPRQHHFVDRNRILAGLSEQTIVVQSKKKSGTLITAEIALSENRSIFTFPGEIFNENFEGNNQLIFQGATPILSFDTVN